MKVLIWVACLFIATLLNTLLGYTAGFKAGYLVIYFVIVFTARKLCIKWDEHKAAKVAKKQSPHSETLPFVETSINADKICFCRKCGEKLIDNSKFCRKCGTEVIEKTADAVSEQTEYISYSPDHTVTDTFHGKDNQKGLD